MGEWMAELLRPSAIRRPFEDVRRDIVAMADLAWDLKPHVQFLCYACGS